MKSTKKQLIAPIKPILSQIDDFYGREHNLKEAYIIEGKTCGSRRHYLDSVKEMLFEVCKI